MTRSTGEEWGLLVKWPSKHDAHCWLRNDDHRPRQSRGRIKYGYNRVQKIVSGTLELMDKRIRRGIFLNVRELVTVIPAYADNHNQPLRLLMGLHPWKAFWPKSSNAKKR